MKLHTEKKNTD